MCQLLYDIWADTCQITALMDYRLYVKYWYDSQHSKFNNSSWRHTMLLCVSYRIICNSILASFNYNVPYLLGWSSGVSVFPTFCWVNSCFEKEVQKITLTTVKPEVSVTIVLALFADLTSNLNVALSHCKNIVTLKL